MDKELDMHSPSELLRCNRCPPKSGELGVLRPGPGELATLLGVPEALELFPGDSPRLVPILCWTRMGKGGSEPFHTTSLTLLALISLFS